MRSASAGGSVSSTAPPSPSPARKSWPRASHRKVAAEAGHIVVAMTACVLATTSPRVCTETRAWFSSERACSASYALRKKRRSTPSCTRARTGAIRKSSARLRIASASGDCATGLGMGRK